MNIYQFINPEEERIEEFVDKILDSIVARHGVEKEAESDKEIEESVPIISPQLLYKLFRPYDLMRSKMENRALILAVF